MKKNTNLVWAVLAGSTLMMLLTTTTGCKKTDEKEMKSFDMAMAQKAVDSCRVAFVDAFNKGDASGVAALYMSDGKFMPPNTTAKEGNDAIKAEIESYFKLGVSSIKLKTLGYWGDENLLSEESTWAIFDKDGKEMDHGKALLTYKKVGGHWKILRDCYNSDLPCPPAPLVPKK